MTFMILSMRDEDIPLYLWGEDSLETAVATTNFDRLFTLQLVEGIVPWKKFLDMECTIIAKHTDLHSSKDVKYLYPELFL